MLADQRRKLAIALRSGNREQVIAACREAVAFWNQPGNGWPEDWEERWQKALDSVAQDGEQLLLEDLPPAPAAARRTTRPATTWATRTGKNRNCSATCPVIRSGS